MKSLRLLLCFFSLGGAVLQAQEPPPTTLEAPPVFLRPDQLDQLLAPIALYPDALIALILPAASDPSDVVLAARYLQGGGDPAQAESQPWEDSVRSLAHYPDVLNWLGQNLAWTKQLGD